LYTGRQLEQVEQDKVARVPLLDWLVRSACVLAWSRTADCLLAARKFDVRDDQCIKGNATRDYQISINPRPGDYVGIERDLLQRPSGTVNVGIER
jgi:hypothetical protein